jgi:hypothetical protein
MQGKLIIEVKHGDNIYVAKESLPDFSIGIFNDEYIATRAVAAWNYCEGIPTNELESRGADAGFWGRACSRLQGERDTLREENAALRAAVAEMQRMLPVLNGIDADVDLLGWAKVTKIGIATLNAYKSTLEAALAKIESK